jgi:hypothetical protein
MKKIPPNRVRSHADFDLTPLGMWADRPDTATLRPGAPHLQQPLPNPFLSDGLLRPGAPHVQPLPNPFLSDGLGEIRGISRSEPRLSHEKPA